MTVPTQLLVAAALAVALAAPVQAQTLRIGLTGDPDILDPDMGRTLVGRHVFEAVCDKLLDYDADLNFVPRLATGWAWSDDSLALTLTLREDVVFHDGERFDAEAVRFNFERSLTMPESLRRTDLAQLDRVEVVDDFTVTLHLKAPFAPMLAQMTDRAGTMISPKAAADAGAQFGQAPVCSGPFRFVERISQDRIVLERFEDYWEPEAIHFDRVEFRPMPDATIRLASLQSGDIDLMERAAPTDLPVIAGDARVDVAQAVELGYQAITINLGNGSGWDNDLGTSAAVRVALELAIDRRALNHVAFDGTYTPGHLFVSPESPYFLPEVAFPERDVERARAVLAEAGIPNPTFTLMVPNDTERLAISQVIQAMAAEAGFDIRLETVEFATSLQRATAGEFEAYLLAWSGRIDPDGNLYQFAACGAPQNDSGYCNEAADRAMDAARTELDPETRRQHYLEAFRIFDEAKPRLYLYHRTWLFAHAANLDGLVPNPDGLIRLRGLAFGS